MPDEIVKMEHINKEFSGVQVLKDVKLTVNQGEVLALVGENGAGKSTLMNILTGVYRKTSGSIYISGKAVNYANVREAQDDGVVMIHQELNLMPHLSVSDNIFIGREFRDRSGFFLDKRRQKEETKKLFERLNVNISPDVRVGSLTVAQQQMVEIAKALAFNSKVLVMDEPTAALTDNEIKDLFSIIRKLKTSGCAIIHISHRLEELKIIADRITVMRDGEYVDTVNAADVSIDHIINMMVGREIFISKQKMLNIKDPICTLEVKHLNAGTHVKDVSFKAYKGEILGFSGLVGAGRTETARVIFGADTCDSGEIFIQGEKVSIKKPSDAVSAGIAYLSEDRRKCGLALGLSVEENISLPNLKQFSSFGFVQTKKCFENANRRVRELSIKARNIMQLTKFLSGGNQQKVVLSKWLTKNSEIIIFDEPTRGIDVGAKSEIYKLLNDRAGRGKTIIVIASDLPEIIRCCHRVLVMCEGKITAELKGDEISQDVIMKYATMRNL